MKNKQISEYKVEIARAGNVTVVRVICYTTNPDGTERRSIIGHKEVAEDNAEGIAKQLDDEIYNGIRHAIDTSDLFEDAALPAERDEKETA